MRMAAAEVYGNGNVGVRVTSTGTRSGTPLGIASARYVHNSLPAGNCTLSISKVSMRPPCISVLLFVLAIVSFGSAFAKDEDRLCGTWAVSSVPGSASSMGTEVTFFYLLSGLEMEWTQPGTGIAGAPARAEFKATIAASMSPKRIDLAQTSPPGAAAVRRGIYSLDGNKLRLRIPPAGMARPANFTAPLRPGEENLAFDRRPVPAGWTHVSLGTGTGVDVYEKTYSVGSSSKRIHHYVTVADLAKSTIRNMVGAPATSLEAPIDSHYASQYWNKALEKNTVTRKLKVLVNGSYFTGPNLGPSSMDHGLKKDGTIWGYGVKNTAEPRRIPHLRTFSFGDGWAQVQPHSRATFNNPNVPNVVGGIATSWPVDSTAIGGRNFVAIRDDDDDGVFETVLFFITNQARQLDGVLALSRFGVSEHRIVMLDGGNSTRLVVDGVFKVEALFPLANQARRLPHVISIYMGK